MKNKSICILFTLVAFCIIYIRMSEEVINYNNYFEINNTVKYVDSDIIEAVVGEVSVLADANEKEETVEKVTPVIEEVIQPVVESKPVVEEIKEVIPDVPVLETSNEIVIGKMSGYGPDCAGCGGYVAYGKYVGNGNIYYNDSEYGNVRIVAGDKKYKFGTIVKINDSMLAIVLDRGGSIGIGKKFLFDLLYESEAEANKNGVSNNVKFEILRNGF